MKKPITLSILAFFAISLGVFTGNLQVSNATTKGSAPKNKFTPSKKTPLTKPQSSIEPKEFDVLDGRGLSRKKVDVIEWENNLEIHVYPKGSLKSLGLKVDRQNENRSVMVIEYAFNGVPYTLIRRAVLTLKISDSFKVFKDPSPLDYDKIMISNNTLTDSVVPFLAVTTPRAMVPDHYGEPEEVEEKIETPKLSESSPPHNTEPKFAEEEARVYEGIKQNARNNPGLKMKEKERTPANLDDEGNIRSFEF